MNPLRVLVVDDDFMIANLHARFVDTEPSFTVVGRAHNADEALQQLRQTQPDLMILDVYLPDQSGIELLTTMRMNNIPCDVILITAAKETDVIESGFRLGVFDYLIKPFDLNRLGTSLQKYAEYRQRLQQTQHLDQKYVDELQKIRSLGAVTKPAWESGIDPRTLERIQMCLARADGPQTAGDVARYAGVSRSTARTYLDYLVEQGWAMEELQYGTVGRPRRLFRRPDQPVSK